MGARRFEPPTSWVRFRLLVAEEVSQREVTTRDKWLADAEFSTLPSAKNSRQPPEWEPDSLRICGDYRRFRHKSVFVPDRGESGYNSFRSGRYERKGRCSQSQRHSWSRLMASVASVAEKPTSWSMQDRASSQRRLTITASASPSAAFRFSLLL